MVFIPPDMSGFRLRRSVLFMPASNRRALEKAPTLPCDCVIFDLEDAVDGEDRQAARFNLLELVKDRDFGRREVIVRIGELTDLDAAIACKPDAILLPKISEAGTVLTVSRLLEEKGVPVALWAMIETPLGLLNVKEIACASPRLKCLVAGPNDLARETGINGPEARSHLHPLLMMMIAAARAHGLSVLDGVYNRFRDIDGFAVECIQAAAMGFDGKTLVHPTQIEPANEKFGPTGEEIARAKAIVNAFDLKENRNKGVIQLNGEMFERLHLRQAGRLLELVRGER